MFVSRHQTEKHVVVDQASVFEVIGQVFGLRLIQANTSLPSYFINGWGSWLRTNDNGVKVHRLNLLAIPQYGGYPKPSSSISSASRHNKLISTVAVSVGFEPTEEFFILPSRLAIGCIKPDSTNSPYGRLTV